jgi:cytochrome c-type biogenesis protein CcmH
VSRAAVVLLAALALAAAALPGAALAATPRASLPDIEDEVMCVECGTPLAVSQSPVANQERALIRRGIAAGRSKQQIKDDLVAEYGTAVLAEPEGGGVDLAVWWVPVILFPLALLGAALAARRWRRSGAAATGAAPEAAALDPAEARRLDAELSAFDS